MRIVLSLFVAAAFAGCGQLPDIAEPVQGIDGEAEYPRFVRLEKIMMSGAEVDERALETEEAVAARVAALRARAARLRTAKID